MKLNLLLLMLGIILPYMSIAQNIDLILDSVHERNQKETEWEKNLGDYKFKQNIHFIKMDSDDEIEEQSKREFDVFVHGPGQHKRIVISALNWEDGVWTDVTEEEVNKSGKQKTESRSFSLDEMIAPENRKFYEFKFVGSEDVNGHSTYHITAKPLEEDEEKFTGDLWFSRADYGLVAAKLIPSENPTGVKSMHMNFEMQLIQGHWRPLKIDFDAEISFLLFFKGKIKSEILFRDFNFNHVFDPSMFETD